MVRGNPIAMGCAVADPSPAYSSGGGGLHSEYHSDWKTRHFHACYMESFICCAWTFANSAFTVVGESVWIRRTQDITFKERKGGGIERKNKEVRVQ